MVIYSLNKEKNTSSKEENLFGESMQYYFD